MIEKRKKGFSVSKSEVPAQLDRKPVENLCKRDKTDPKAKSTEAAEVGDEVQPSHLWQPLKFCKQTFLDGFHLQFAKLRDID